METWDEAISAETAGEADRFLVCELKFVGPTTPEEISLPPLLLLRVDGTTSFLSHLPRRGPIC